MSGPLVPAHGAGADGLVGVRRPWRDGPPSVTGRRPGAIRCQFRAPVRRRGLDEARRGYAKDECATQEQQWLPAGEALDVAEDLTRIVLPQVHRDSLGLI